MFESREGTFGLQTLDFQTSEFRIPSDFRLQTSKFRLLQNLDLRLLRTSDFGLQILVSIFQFFILCCCVPTWMM